MQQGLRTSAVAIAKFGAGRVESRGLQRRSLVYLRPPSLRRSQVGLRVGQCESGYVSGKVVGRAAFCSGRGEKREKDSAGPGSGGSNSSEGEGSSKGFFSNLQTKLEDGVSKNPELGKSFQDVKAAMPFSASAADSKLKAAAEQLGKAAEGASDASERLKAAAKEGGEAAAKFASRAKNEETQEKDSSQGFGHFAQQVWQELRPNSNAASSDASADADKSKSKENLKTKGEHDQDENASPWGKASFGDKVQETTKRVAAALPESFGNDDKTWGDALRAVFGMRPTSKKAAPSTGSAETADMESMGQNEENGATQWYEAVDKESGEVYYYTKDGRTVWEKPDELKTSEELAKDWADQQGQREPSFLEKQIQSKTEEISRLEQEREAAMTASEMDKFKEINAQIRILRKEVESLSAQANTTAVVHVEEQRGAWEQFGDTLRDTPILKGLFGFGAKLGETEAAKRARNVAEDAREAWETSQNPWVYSAYSAWESVFAETEMGETIRELRKLDPSFTFENMLVELEEEIVPDVLKAYLRGDVATLDKWCSEAAAAAVKASINQRNAAGRKMDDNILSIDHMQVAAAKVVDKMGPLVVVQFMVQQIDCLYDLKGKVVDGRDDKVAAVFYAFALGREYNEEEAELEWKIREFAIIGTQPWI